VASGALEISMPTYEDPFSEGLRLLGSFFEELLAWFGLVIAVIGIVAM
jgi:hypothetical protein